MLRVGRQNMMTTDRLPASLSISPSPTKLGTSRAPYASQTTHSNVWTPTSWKDHDYPIRQQPRYRDPKALQNALQQRMCPAQLYFRVTCSMCFTAPI